MQSWDSNHDHAVQRGRSAVKAYNTGLMIRKLLTANNYPHRNCPSWLTMTKGRFSWRRRDFYSAFIP